MGQLSLFDAPERPTPAACPHERKTVEWGRQLKSYCDEMGLWTNCRHWGHCTSSGRRERVGEVVED